ncbi:DUF389 domain-containing protein [Thermococcus sp.]|uniref:DUF389 domain-containing protein n=1 Tax=Thermococcus sp. TaxID=35749 RepID=UPI00262D0C9B|nr:DUF389 domain-containing protein [Thermococcus sp.]
MASIIALFGLITNSVAMMISAMLLSPILDPLYGFAINIVMGRGRDAAGALRSILQLLIVVSASAFLRTLILRSLGMMPPSHRGKYSSGPVRVPSTYYWP